jgi:hypothetical protein
LIDTRPTSLSLPIGHFFHGYMNALVLGVITSARIDTLATNEPRLVLDWVTQPISYGRHRFPPDIIQHAVWLYLQFTLSYRDVEDLLAERGLMSSNESIRRVGS